MRPPMGGKVEKEACRLFHSPAIFHEWLTPIIKVKARFTNDTLLIRKPHYWGQFWKKSLCIFSKFNPLNTDTSYDPQSVCFNGVWLCYLSFPTYFLLMIVKRLPKSAKLWRQPASRKLEDFWGFGVRSSLQFYPRFCSQPITKPGFY